MKKLSLFLLCLILVIGTLGAVATSAEETGADGLVEFVGYSARINEFNGIRAEYTLNTTALAELEETYNIQIGILMNPGVADDDYATEMVIGSTNVDKTFYSTADGYVGSYYDKDENDGKIEFVYTIKFENPVEGSTLEQDYLREVSYRAYISLTPKAGGDTQITYIDNASDKFGYAVSMSELAKALVATEDQCYPMLQRVVDDSLSDAVTINGITIDKYSVIVDELYDIYAARAISASVKEATGYALPVINGDANYNDAYIHVVTNAENDNKYAYEVVVEGGVIEVVANNIISAAEAIEFAKADEIVVESAEGTIYDYDYDKLYVKYDLIYQADFFDAKASMGSYLGSDTWDADYFKTTEAAGNRFMMGSTPATRAYYNDFVTNANLAGPYGGTMPILTPWTSTKEGVTEWEMNQSQYMWTNGQYGKQTFTSKWQDGFVEMGYQTTFHFDYMTSKFEARLSDDGERIEGGKYTIQTVMALGKSEYKDETGATKNGGSG